MICWFSLKRKKLASPQKETTTPPIYDNFDIDAANVGINRLELKENHAYEEGNDYY